MNAAKRHIEILQHRPERGGKRRAPADQDVIMTRAQRGVAFGRRQPHHFPQPAAHPVTLDGIPHLFRDGKADAHGTVIPPRARLQNEGGAGCPRAARSGPKIASAPQPFDGEGGTGIAFTH